MLKKLKNWWKNPLHSTTFRVLLIGGACAFAVYADGGIRFSKAQKAVFNGYMHEVMIVVDRVAFWK